MREWIALSGQPREGVWGGKGRGPLGDTHPAVDAFVFMRSRFCRRTGRYFAGPTGGPASSNGDASGSSGPSGPPPQPMSSSSIRTMV